MEQQTITCKVNGVTFEGRQQIIEQLTGSEQILIEPEPGNRYDKNALRVLVSLFNGRSVVQCGYVPRELAKRVAPLLAGRVAEGHIIEITGGGRSDLSLGMVIEFVLPESQSVP